MRRPMSCILLLTWALLAAGCGDSHSPNGSAVPDDGSSQVISDSLFADRGLEVAVRATLGRPVGSISQQELSSLKDLDASGLGIKSLEGLGRLDSLQSLNLADNEVTDLSPLAALIRLEYLDLSRNQVTEIAALAPLAQLKVLILEQSAVPDLSPLQGLSHLERLELTEGMVAAAATEALQASGVKVVWAMAGESPSTGGVDTAPQLGAGPRIAYSEVKAVRNGDGDIWVIAPDGSDRKVLICTSVNETEPAWSPDGTQLAYAQGADGFRRIYVRQSGSKEPVRLTQDRGDEYSPSWSPDGSKIAYVRGYDIYVSAVYGSTSENLTQHPAKDFDPAWSPDGQRIIFASNRDLGINSRLSDIFAMDADGRNAVNLTRHSSRNNGPCFSPDGTRIAFFSSRDRGDGSEANYDVFVMGADGSDLHNLTGQFLDGIFSMRPRVSWSADDRLYFVYQGILMSMAPDGSDQTSTLSSFAIESPAWVADAAMDLAGLEEEPPRFFASALLERVVLAQLGYTEVTEMDLSRVTAVTCLDCGIRDLEGIEKLRALQSLHLGNGWKVPSAVPDETWNQIEDLALLEGLQELRELSLALGPQADLAPLAHLDQLTTLELTGDGIKDLGPLSSLHSLTHLSLTGNQISDLGPLSGLSSLIELSLTNSRVSDLAPLAALGKLRKLSVSDGPVWDLTPLSRLKCLIDLSLYRCPVEDLSPLSGLPLLSNLSASYNQIREVSPLLEIPMLRNAILIGNPLSSRALETDIPALEERGVYVSY